MSNPNFIPDLNRFNLAAPPGWFLEKLRQFDDSLVIIPSRQHHGYRLAQRRTPVLKDKICYEAMKEQADTAMMMSYKLVPVTTIVASPNWGNPLIFQTLTDRAPWRMGGADKVNKMLDAQDQREALDIAAKNDLMTTDLSKDAWKFYQMKIGTRSHLYSPTTKSGDTSRTMAPGIKVSNKKAYRPNVRGGFGRADR